MRWIRLSKKVPDPEEYVLFYEKGEGCVYGYMYKWQTEEHEPTVWCSCEESCWPISHFSHWARVRRPFRLKRK